MKKTLLEIYALLICLGAVICFAISLGIGVYSMIGIIDPEITLDSWEYSKHQSNDAYWEDKRGSLYVPVVEPKEVEPPVRPNKNELTKQRLESFASAIKIEKRESKQSVLRISIILFICTILFFIHWRIAKKTRN
jgi:hypothetical protein